MNITQIHDIILMCIMPAGLERCAPNKVEGWMGHWNANRSVKTSGPVLPKLGHAFKAMGNRFSNLLLEEVVCDNVAF